MRNYFRLSNSFYGEVYFRISEQLGWLPSEVIKKKYNPDIKFLIFKHSARLRAEMEQNKRLQEQMKEYE